MASLTSDGAEIDAAVTTDPSTTHRLVFRALVVLSALFLALVLVSAGPFLVFGWVPTAVFEAQPDQGFDLAHRLHETIMGVLTLAMFLGVVLQLHRPERKLAPMLAAVAAATAFSLGDLLSGITDWFWPNTAPLLLATVAVALAHPRLRELLAVRRVDGTMAVLAGIATYGWLVVSLRGIDLQRAGAAGDVHAAMEHWSRMATFGIAMVLWAWLATTDRPGWRVVAWLTGAGAVTHGLQSLLWPTSASALATWTAVASVAWAVVWLGATERRGPGGPSL
jgi:hypothetical protein